MFAKKILLKGLVLLACLFLLSASTALSQDFCEGDFDYDGDVDGMDALGFKADFGRMQDSSDPCPPDGPAPVPKTGQTTCYDETGASRPCAGTGEDGEYQKGVAWPDPRFTDHEDGTVTDNVTGLMWTQNAQEISGAMKWADAIDACNDLELGEYTDWRLPNVKELISLIDYGNSLSLPDGHPFDNVFMPYYWSSTTNMYNKDYAWLVSMAAGNVNPSSKTINVDVFVWPVRGGQ